MRLSYRRTEALLRDTGWCARLGMSRVPDHVTLCRAFAQIVMPAAMGDALDDVVHRDSLSDLITLLGDGFHRAQDRAVRAIVLLEGLPELAGGAAEHRPQRIARPGHIAIERHKPRALLVELVEILLGDKVGLKLKDQEATQVLMNNVRSFLDIRPLRLELGQVVDVLLLGAQRRLA